ncbi:SAM-dependent methyltransferase [Actinoplanes sp. Pm04-4]|uniref:SAM-dependent methyltransferase n=1 Tax=Paractinoplanes pyxinae TaxID=2997416 RepID=A0ABT4BC12_9ACTN|nr:SAM-dependent methyltransferase [Actinoplanes pyxinae]MCY1144053.1 SAM-dependent methyltransferase [Actinoplanes pyxinae]
MTDHPPLDPTEPNPARRYAYWLGGKDHFAADRASGDLIAETLPTIRYAAIANREFLRRATTFLASQQGITQFLDIGCGLPTDENTHQIAQRFTPGARTVYVDNDPLVAVHGRALLERPHPSAITTFVEADLRQPAAILDNKRLQATFNLQEPVGLLLVAVLHFLDDNDHPHALVRQLLDALAPGSWLVISHGSQDLLVPKVAAAAAGVIAKSGVPTTLRSRDEIGDFFTGLELAPPGLVPVQRWRARTRGDIAPDTAVGIYGGAARKP